MHDKRYYSATCLFYFKKRICSHLTMLTLECGMRNADLFASNDAHILSANVSRFARCEVTVKTNTLERWDRGKARSE